VLEPSPQLIAEFGFLGGLAVADPDVVRRQKEAFSFTEREVSRAFATLYKGWGRERFENVKERTFSFVNFRKL
jgi:hypothetical protein